MKAPIDDLDRRIIRELQADSRKPFLEIARDMGVAGGTIHSRVNRLREEGVITGSKITLDSRSLGYDVSAFIGVRFDKAGNARTSMEALQAICEVVEIHYTTGTYSLLLKVVAKDMAGFYEFLSTRLQAIPEIQSTETFMILNTSLCRDLEI